MTNRFVSLLVLLAGLLPWPISASTLPAGQPLTADMARELVEAALPESGPGERWHVQLAPAGFPLPNQARTDGWMEIESIAVEPRTGLLDASLRVTLAGGEAGVIALRGRAEAQAEVPVPARPLRRGHRIEAADLRSAWLPSARLDRDTVLTVSELVGHEAERGLAAGRAIRAGDLRAARLVRKDETVSLLFRRGGLELASAGTALDNGAEGETVRVVNPSGGRPVRGIVVGLRTVEVGVGPSEAAR
ncbi:MAG TPA: flagellar basal body P-ring formation chaperone FlgA [Geminicoccaceae bacterium]|nr:flagellar basal body P-ring formation chaperone FlgA [Geminicoccus sp.]HMU48196.1 flagellar basal body P-ring formation chaperone FlgA [Geminicoccaceae bacterium]